MQNAITAAKAVADLAQQGKQAEAAAAEAEKAALAQIPAGTDPAAAKQQVDMAKGIAAMNAMAGAAGPAVNWRLLAPVLPEALPGGFAAKGELKGSTKKMGAFELSEVSRRYVADKREVRIEITDTSAHAMLRAPFTMVALTEEDSSDGYRKGKTFAGHPGIVEWKAKSKSSVASALVAGRFVVHVRIRDAATETEAESVLAALKLDDLAKLATAAAAPPAAPPAAP